MEISEYTRFLTRFKEAADAGVAVKWLEIFVNAIKNGKTVDDATALALLESTNSHQQ